MAGKAVTGKAATDLAWCPKTGEGQQGRPQSGGERVIALVVLVDVALRQLSLNEAVNTVPIRITVQEAQS